MGSWTPSIVPNGDDQNVYLVVNDFGRHGTAWCETDVEETDLENVITDLLDGQYNSPVRVVGFNVAERWARDVSEDVAEEIQRRCDGADWRLYAIDGGYGSPEQRSADVLAPFSRQAMNPI